jgi:hypothetical protein
MRFVNNKYRRWYRALMAKARHRTMVSPLIGYKECHHVIPRSLGGKNTKRNLVELTAREHFIAHRLLLKFTKGKAHSKMWFAMNMLHVAKHQVTNRVHIISSHTYANLRRERHKIKQTSDQKRLKEYTRYLDLHIKRPARVSTLGQWHTTTTVEMRNMVHEFIRVHRIIPIPNKVKDLRNSTYGMLTVVKYVGESTKKSYNNSALWECHCRACGRTVVTEHPELRSSCGCMVGNHLKTNRDEQVKCKQTAVLKWIEILKSDKPIPKTIGGFTIKQLKHFKANTNTAFKRKIQQLYPAWRSVKYTDTRARLELLIQQPSSTKPKSGTNEYYRFVSLIKTNETFRALVAASKPHWMLTHRIG